jgi:hypothetical protein
MTTDGIKTISANDIRYILDRHTAFVAVSEISKLISDEHNNTKEFLNLLADNANIIELDKFFYSNKIAYSMIEEANKLRDSPYGRCVTLYLINRFITSENVRSSIIHYYRLLYFIGNQKYSDDIQMHLMLNYPTANRHTVIEYISAMFYDFINNPGFNEICTDNIYVCNLFCIIAWNKIINFLMFGDNESLTHAIGIFELLILYKADVIPYISNLNAIGINAEIIKLFKEKGHVVHSGFVRAFCPYPFKPC